MTHYDKPPLDEALLLHYGVKGMKWGVRKKDDSGTRQQTKAEPTKSEGAKLAATNELTKGYIAASSNRKNLTKKESAAALAENQKKFLAKFEPSGAEGAEAKKGLTPKQKKILIGVGVGLVVVGGVVAYKHYSAKAGISANTPLSLNQLREMAGNPISVQQFQLNQQMSTQAAWGGGSHIFPSSFLRGEQTLPAGHTFHRLSSAAEKHFAPTTYATSNMEDFHRYVNNFRGEIGTENLKHITFSTTKPMRIPSLSTTLETLKEVVSKTEGVAMSHESAIEAYSNISGGDWGSQRAAGLMRALGNKGYGALVDEMDAGVVGNSPLVVFAKEHLTPKKAVDLTADIIANAESSLIELTHRKL